MNNIQYDLMSRHSTQVLVEQNPSPMKLEILNVEDWPIIKEPVGVSERNYAQTETSLIVAGAGYIEAENGIIVALAEGDLLTVLPETRCVWNITEAIERHYYNG